MSRFWDLLERSVIVQGCLTLMVVGAVCYLACVGRVIPEQLGYAMAAVLGFWFGSKAASEARHIAKGVQSKQDVKDEHNREDTRSTRGL